MSFTSGFDWSGKYQEEAEEVPFGVENNYDPKNEEYVKDGFFRKMKRYAGKIPFAKDAAAMYFCAVDSKTPLYAKGIAFAALAYFISPVDAIPDALIAIGLTDDLSVIMAAIKALGSNVNEEHNEQAQAFFS